MGNVVEIGSYEVDENGELYLKSANEGQSVIFRNIKQDKFVDEYTRIDFKSFTINDDMLYRDCMSLSDNALKIFMAFCNYIEYITCYAKNINGSYVNNKQIEKITNKSSSSVKRGIKELIDKGFLAKSFDINGIKCFVINPYYAKRNSKQKNDYYLTSSVNLFIK